MKKKYVKDMKKKRILAVGDLHGRHEIAYKAIQLFKNKKCDKLIFIGDYCDSFNRTNDDILETLKLVLAIKQEYPDDVILILGNHDISYKYTPDFECTGQRAELLPTLKYFFEENSKYFQIAHLEVDGKNKYLFTHAGVQKKWFNKYKNRIAHYEIYGFDLAGTLNCIDQTRDRWILNELGTKRGGIRYDYGGPTWCDKTEMESYGPIPGYHQIVGHTHINHIEKVTKFEGDKHYENTSVTFIDVLSDLKEPQFYELKI